MKPGRMDGAGTKHPGQLAFGGGRSPEGYELLCAVGHGGMASVWAAGRRGPYGLDRLVAIKTILPEHASDERFLEVLVHEAGAASGIEHIHVARTLDVGEDDGLLYVVTEWINGHSLSNLRHRVSERGVLFPLGVALRILIGVCRGLHAGHEQCDVSGKPVGLVHRIISPHKILINTRGLAKLIDFGVAGAFDRADEDSPSGVQQTRLAYMAPEQARDGAIDRRVDVWAVGAILYKLVSDKGPFWGDQRGLLSGAERAPLPAHVHPAVAAIIDRAMKLDPDQRYSTAAELGAALRLAMEEADVPTTNEDVAHFLFTHLGEAIAARRDLVARAVILASQDQRRADRDGRVIGRRLQVVSSRERDPFPVDESFEETTTARLVPRDDLAGALAGLLGSIALLAVVASGLVLRPTHVHKTKGTSTPTVDMTVPAATPVSHNVAESAANPAPAAVDLPTAELSEADPGGRRDPPRPSIPSGRRRRSTRASPKAKAPPP
jgi:hypothetical protein